jgi:hypothetical protein
MSHRLQVGLMLIAAAALAHPAGAAELKSLSCRTQVIAYCDKDCEFGGGPADLSFDFAKGTIDYCRGEQCDEGKIKTTIQKGQWDDQDYLLFFGEVKRGGKVWGVISIKPMTFYANGDAGNMIGNCVAD